MACRPTIVMGIWGIETDFGNNFGDANVFEALTNLGYRANRQTFACTELLAALDIVVEEQGAGIAHGRIVGRRDGASAIPAVQLPDPGGGSRRVGHAGPLGRRCPMRLPRPPITWSTTAGSAICPGASK